MVFAVLLLGSDLPSRILLETHADIATIFHASGGAEQIEEVLEDLDPTSGD
jgi:hypothetical protein